MIQLKLPTAAINPSLKWGCYYYLSKTNYKRLNGIAHLLYLAQNLTHNSNTKKKPAMNMNKFPSSSHRGEVFFNFAVKIKWIFSKKF